MAWLILIIIAAALPANGQTLFTRPYLPSTLSMEAVRPAYQNSQLSATTGALFFTGSYTLDKNIELVAELPVAHADGDNIASTTALGNPLLGLGLSSTRIPFLVELGVRFPVSKRNVATQLARAADYGRGAAFLAKEKQAYVLSNTRFMIGRKTSVRFRGGLAFGIFEEPDSSGTDVTQRDLRLRYAVQIWREGDWLITGASFTGRGITTAPGSYSDKSRHHFAFTALLDFERVAPGITVGIPLNSEDRDIASFVFGASVDVRLW